MTPFFSITISTLKMLFRNKQSLFFAWFLPLFLMLVIGYITQGSNDLSLKVGVVYNHDNQAAQTVVDAMSEVDSFEITTDSNDAERAELQNNKRDLVVVLPEDFSLQPKGEPYQITLLENAGNPQQSGIAGMVVNQFFQQFTLQAVQAPQLFNLKAEEVSANGARYVDFLVPGILAMTIMQLGVFGTAFAIVDAKQKGVLKRVVATPVKPWQYVIGNMVARLILSLTQAAIIVAVARLVFDVRFHNWGWLILLVILGNVVFLSLGLFISGVAKSVETVPVLGNLIVFPMLLLGGIFFPTTGLPEWLKFAVDKLPVALLADLMRNTVTLDKTLTEVWQPLLGLAVWGVVMMFLANKFFALQERD